MGFGLTISLIPLLAMQPISMRDTVTLMVTSVGGSPQEASRQKPCLCKSLRYRLMRSTDTRKFFRHSVAGPDRNRLFPDVDVIIDLSA